MGCGNNQKVVIEPIRRMDTPKGVLEVQLVEAHLDRDTALMLKMDPYVVIKMNNQVHTSKVIPKGGDSPKFDDKFTYFLNSDKQVEGRTLEVTVWDKNTISDKQVGFGIVDVDPVIMNKQQNFRQKCYINFESKAAGYVILNLGFKEEFKGILYMHVQTAALKRKTSLLSDMKCVARITIGEEQEQTSISKDTKEAPPRWTQAFRLNIIESNMVGQLDIVDINMSSESLIGSVELNIQKLLENTVDKQFTEELKFNNEVAGTVTYSACYLSLEGVLPSNMEAMISQKDTELAEGRRKREEERIRKEEQEKAAKAAAAAKLKAEEQQKKRKAQEEEAAKKAAAEKEKEKEKENKDKMALPAQPAEAPKPAAATS